LSENKISIKRGNDTLLLRQIPFHPKKKRKKKKKEKGNKQRRDGKEKEKKQNVNTLIMM